MDGSEVDKEKDFESVRGDFINNPFVSAIRKHIIDKTTLAERTLNRLSAIL